jgi:hypothetical protein
VLGAQVYKPCLSFPSPDPHHHLLSLYPKSTDAMNMSVSPSHLKNKPITAYVLACALRLLSKTQITYNMFHACRHPKIMTLQAHAASVFFPKFIALPIMLSASLLKEATIKHTLTSCLLDPKYEYSLHMLATARIFGGTLRPEMLNDSSKVSPSSLYDCSSPSTAFFDKIKVDGQPDHVRSSFQNSIVEMIMSDASISTDAHCIARKLLGYVICLGISVLAV